MPEAKFDVEISEARVLEKFSRMVRFTLTWRLEHPEWGLLGVTTKGCLLVYDRDGNPTWHHPKVAYSAKKNVDPHTSFPDYHQLVLTLLRETGLVEKMGPWVPKQGPYEPLDVPGVIGGA